MTDDTDNNQEENDKQYIKNFIPKFKSRKFDQWFIPTLKAELDKRAAGQHAAKLKLASLTYLYQNKLMALDNGIRNTSLPRLNLFVTGPTGYGKTFLLTELANIINLPFIRIDCSSITGDGWTGDSLAEVLHKQLQYVDLESQPGCLILLDEMDKIVAPAVGSGGTNHSLITQQVFLDVMDGKFSSNYDKSFHKNLNLSNFVNTSLIICAGSFETERKANQDIKQNIGFTRTEKETQINLDKWKESMVKCGMLPELAGRIIEVIELEKLKLDEVLEIFDKETSAYAKYKAVCPGFYLSKEQKIEIAKHTIDSKFGLRELESLIFKKLSEKLNDIK